MPLDVKDSDGIARLALALNERYGRLDVLVGNAGILGALSPLDHVEPKDWDNMIAVNVTANWQLIRTMAPLLKAAPAGRAVFLTSAVAHMGRAYWGPYAASKAALEVLVRTYAAENATTNVRANLFGPGPTRTRMYLGAFPGVDPLTLPTPDQVARSILPLCLPECTETGKIYDFPREGIWNSGRRRRAGTHKIGFLSAVAPRADKLLQRRDCPLSARKRLSHVQQIIRLTRQRQREGRKE